MTAPILATDFDAVRAELARTSISATTMNFIVWIDDIAFRPWVVERMTKILEKHPARAIMLDACADREPGAKLVRSIPNDADASHITVHSERIEIGVRGMSPTEISELSGSLKIHELPSLLWWTGEGIAEQPNFCPLVDLVDSLVVDSSGTRNDATTVTELASFLASRPTVALRDLAWMRLRPWQDIIARFFDDPALMEELYSVVSLCIVSGSDAESLYLAGWLGSRLGWTASGQGEFTDGKGAPIPFAHERLGRIRRVGSVELTTSTSKYTTSVSNDDAGLLVVNASGKAQRPGRLVPLPAIDSPSLLERAILEPATDEVFETALRMVGTLSTDGSRSGS